MFSRTLPNAKIGSISHNSLQISFLIILQHRCHIQKLVILCKLLINSKNITVLILYSHTTWWYNGKGTTSIVVTCLLKEIGKFKFKL